jgi:ribosome modulation factor
MMKRQKRDRQNRAHSRGYQAGMAGHSKSLCPYQSVEIKMEWLGGWREAISDKKQGIHNP